MKIMNPLVQCDFYKVDHISQYPEGTELVYSNFTPRSGNIFRQQWPEWDGLIVWVGLQGFVKEFLIDTFNEGFFNLPADQVVNAYKRRLDTSLGPDSVDVEHVRNLHKLGYLPLHIKSIPEGSLVPEKVAPLTVRNTTEGFDWLAGWVTNRLETVFSSGLWKPSTNATIAREYHKLLTEYAIKTGTPVELVGIQGHDFSARGLTYKDTAATGFAHLCYFVGTDTVASIDYAEDYYNANAENELIGCSVPASEHSVMTIAGPQGEFELIKRLVTEIYPSGIVSLVLDGFDLWNAITVHIAALKEEILARTPNALGLAKVVVRPDSGDPVKILCGEAYTFSKGVTQEDIKPHHLLEVKDYLGYDYFTLDGKYFNIEEIIDESTMRTVGKAVEVPATPELKGVIECLWDIFGGTITSTGHKQLHERIAAIYGDSITLPRAKAILARLEAKDFASGNIVFGIGSFTYQYNTRDTFGWAMKTTAAVVNGELKEVFKDPITDKGSKKSAKGLLRVEKENGKFVMYDQQTWEQEGEGALETVFLNGKLVKETSLSEIRNRLWGSQ